MRWALASSAGLALLLVSGCDGERPGAPAQQQVARSAVTAGACSPIAAHPKHASAACATCHVCDGVVEFNPSGPAVVAGQPFPAFDASSKSCTNAGCHGVAPGTFSYWVQNGAGEAELVTFSYGSTPRPTPSWLTTGLGCTGCHDNPPRNSVWHSGLHAGQGPTGAANQCQFCHPDAKGANGIGTTITNPALHANRVVEVQAQFRSSCFGCH
jgi:hypothetical protein